MTDQVASTQESALVPDNAALVARIAALEAENLRLSNAVIGRYLPGLLDPDETAALVDFIRSLRKDAAAFRASTTGEGK